MTDKKIEYLCFPPVRGKVITLCEQDGNHYAEAGEDLLLWMRDYRDLDYTGRGERWLQNHGTRPRNVEPSMYAANEMIYRPGFQFYPGMVATAGIIVGARHTQSDEGREYVARLLESGAVKKIGRIVSSGNWNEHQLTLEGADLYFGTLGFAYKNCAHSLDAKGYAASLRAGRYFMTCSALALAGRGTPSMVEAGWLIPGECLENPDGLVAQGRVIEAGTMKDDFSDLELVPHVAALYRAIAVIAEDCRLHDTKRSDAQEKYITDLFAQAVETGRKVPVCG